jgi:hypothetical protein
MGDERCACAWIGSMDGWLHGWLATWMAGYLMGFSYDQQFLYSIRYLLEPLSPR